MTVAPTMLDVPVDGGTLRVARWGAGPSTVLAPHGITANHVSWSLVAQQLPPDVTMLAPDLRGRGDSADLPGPSSMARHAADLLAVLDHVGRDRAVVAGHSMGGFVGVRAGLDHPDRVAGLLLLDGGLALPVPGDADVDTVLVAVLGPAMQRLSMTFADRAAYHAHWRDHPALASDWGPVVEAYLDHDVHEVDGRVVSRVVADRVREDGRDTLVDDALRVGFPDLSMPVTFARAPRGLMDADPLYPAPVVELFAAQLPSMRVVELHDVNHYTLLLAETGAAQVATLLDETVEVLR